jgi:hypothetical protein
MGRKSRGGDIGQAFGEGLAEGYHKKLERARQQALLEANPDYIEKQMRLAEIRSRMSEGAEYSGALGEMGLNTDPTKRVAVDSGRQDIRIKDDVHPLDMESRQTANEQSQFTLRDAEAQQPFRLEALRTALETDQFNLGKARISQPYELEGLRLGNRISEAQIPLIQQQTRSGAANEAQTRTETGLLLPKFDWQKYSDEQDWRLREMDIASKEAYYRQKGTEDAKDKLTQKLLSVDAQLNATESTARRELMDFRNDPNQQGQVLRGMGNTALSVAQNLASDPDVPPEVVMNYADKGISYYMESIERAPTPEKKLKELQASTAAMKVFRETRPEIWQRYIDGLAAMGQVQANKRSKVMGVPIPGTMGPKPGFDPLANVQQQLGGQGTIPGGIEGGQVFSDEEARKRALQQLRGR